jgi:hypothetical protein
LISSAAASSVATSAAAAAVASLPVVAASATGHFAAAPFLTRARVVAAAPSVIAAHTLLFQAVCSASLVFVFRDVVEHLDYAGCNLCKDQGLGVHWLATLPDFVVFYAADVDARVQYLDAAETVVIQEVFKVLPHDLKATEDVLPEVMEPPVGLFYYNYLVAQWIR